MYTTCLFCHAPLGTNDVVEHFPVGRRLAYDPARGRLWVVCPSCRQWCLTPLEERWEAIEDAERLFRTTRLRASTDQVGLARMRDGSELVRIGEPQRPEMAAWRYGSRFAARWRRQAAILAGTSVVIGGYIVAGPVMGLVAGGFGTTIWNGKFFLDRFIERRRIVARFERAGGPIVATHEQVNGARLLTAPRGAHGWRLALPHNAEDRRVGSFTLRGTKETDTLAEFEGDEALAVARVILPIHNRWGGRRRMVEDAVRILEREPTPEASFARMAREKWNSGSTLLSRIERPHRLALEMAAHDEIERRALEGELYLLEEAWKEAEEVAAIADGLTLPERIGARIARMRG